MATVPLTDSVVVLCMGLACETNPVTIATGNCSNMTAATSVGLKQPFCFLCSDAAKTVSSQVP